jgi:hypothetical protein
MSRSPFPGMDPYLEGEMWQEFHNTLATQIRAQILPKLKPKYVALLEKRFALDQPTLGVASISAVYPDVAVARTLKETATVAYPATVTPPSAEVVSPLPEEVRLTTVEIRDVAERRLVTVIEILSPVNKRGDGANFVCAGETRSVSLSPLCGAGARDYHERRVRLLQTHASARN